MEDDGEASDENEQEPGKITASHRRREQAVPPALLWRLEQEDQRLKKHDGRWIDIQRLRLLESFVDVYNN